MLTDSHAHLTSSAVFDQLPFLLERAKQKKVETIINICTDLLTLQRGITLSQTYSWIYQAAATPPHDVEKEGDAHFEFIAQTARSQQLKAIGETGLDYYYEHSNRAIQKHFLCRYFELALECHLPLIIHCREAFEDFFDLLDRYYQKKEGSKPGVVHCFTGTLKEAEEILKRGWMISLSGIVTFKKSIELQEIAKQIPLNQLLIETDTPYLAPQLHRGKINEPSFLTETAHFIASLKKISLEELASVTSLNARKLFSIS